MKKAEQTRGVVLQSFFKRVNFPKSNCIIALDIENVGIEILEPKQITYFLYKEDTSYMPPYMRYQLISYGIKDNVLTLYCREKPLPVKRRNVKRT